MKKIKIYSENIEQWALDQFSECMKLDCAIQGALMPDAHQWYTMPIGWVIATKDYIFPSFVWYDIWCWMCAINTWYKKKDLEWLEDKIFNEIYRSVPIWLWQHHKEKQNWNWKKYQSTNIVNTIMNTNWLNQLWTLWSWNHFIEISHDEKNEVWIVIHSWSRGVWHKVASHYMKLARDVNNWEWKDVEKAYWLKVDKVFWLDYILDMNFCLEYALENRKQMIHAVIEVLDDILKPMPILEWWFDKNLINRNHNHAELKNWLWIHRKWATHAEKWMMWVIPWNMRDWSFIVKWKWNPESLYSSSHWAWRVLARNKAKKTLKIEDFKNQMIWIKAKVKESTLDESPSAYKDIFEVMKLQEDLVEIVAYLKPIINIKA